MAKYVRDIFIGIELGNQTCKVATLEDGALRVLGIGQDEGRKHSDRLSGNPSFVSAVNVKHNLVGAEALEPEYVDSTYTNMENYFLQDFYQIINENSKGKITPCQYYVSVLNGLYDASIKLVDYNDDYEYNIKSLVLAVPTDYKEHHKEKLVELVRSSKWGISRVVKVIDNQNAIATSLLQTDPNDVYGNRIVFELNSKYSAVSLVDAWESNKKYTCDIRKEVRNYNVNEEKFDEIIWDLAVESIEEVDVLNRIKTDSDFEADMKKSFMKICPVIKYAFQKDDIFKDVLKLNTENYGTELITISIKREEFDNMALTLYDDIMNDFRIVMEYANSRSIKVDQVIWNETYDINDILTKAIKRDFNILNHYKNTPNTQVAKGASLYAAIVSNEVSYIK